MEYLPTASEAREVTNKHLEGAAIETWLETIAKVIKREAGKGNFSLNVTSLLSSIRLTQPTADQYQVIKKALEEKGYQWVDYPSDHPRSHAYSEISWR